QAARRRDNGVQSSRRANELSSVPRAPLGARHLLMHLTQGGALRAGPGLLVYRRTVGAVGPGGISELRFMLEGESEQRAVAGEVEFLADVAAMGLDGAMADEKLAGNFLVGFIFCDQAQNASFGRRKQCQAFFLFFQQGDALVTLHQELGNRRAEE